MNRIRYVVGALCLLLLSLNVRAADFPLRGIDGDELKKFTGDISTNFLHTSVSGASTLGNIFGFEVGIVGGQGNTPHVNDIVHQTDPSVNAKSIPHGALLGVLTVPFAITGELALVPKVGSKDFKFNTFSIAAKWTPTDLFFDLPFSIAGKLSYTASKLELHNSTSGVDTDYKYDNKETALIALISKNFAIVEPYFGLGMISAKGDLSASGTGSGGVFTSGSTSASSSPSSSVWMIGTEVKLLVVKLGVEYTNAFSTSRYTGKLSFFF